ncbi:MAG: alpha/beta hydrolase [Streptomycetales bacterium]
MKRLELASGDGLRLEVAVHGGDGQSAGTVLLAHGITVDMDEGGMFVRLADRLAEAGFTAVRFSFRGHGGSEGTQAGVTIAGEMLDLQAVFGFAQREFAGPLSVMAASFGAVATCLSLPYLEPDLRSLVLWNPVLDLTRTFVAPELPWGLDNFGPEPQGLLATQGYLLVDGEFRLGRVLFEEFRHYQPTEYFTGSRVPTLIVHGDRDTYVSYEVAQRAAASRPGTDFHTVMDSDHGFDSREREDQAISQTVDWLRRRNP